MVLYRRDSPRSGRPWVRGARGGVRCLVGDGRLSMPNGTVSSGVWTATTGGSSA